MALAPEDPNFAGQLLEAHTNVRNGGLSRGFTLSNGFVSSVWAASGKRYPNKDLGTTFWYCSDGKPATAAAMEGNIRERRAINLFVSEGNRMYDRGPYLAVGSERHHDGQRTHVRFELRRKAEEAADVATTSLKDEVERQRQPPRGRRTVFEAHAYDSRLEATRAVLFRDLRMDFVAHPEPSVPLGLPQRDRYTPDFRLRRVVLDDAVLEDVLWEVKPHLPPAEDLQICQLAADRTGFPTVLDCGRLQDWRDEDDRGPLMLVHMPAAEGRPPPAAVRVTWTADAEGLPALTSQLAAARPLDAMLRARDFVFDS